MDQGTQDGVAAIMARETWSAQDHEELLGQLLAMNNAPRKFRAMLAQMEAESPAPSGEVALKIGMARYMLCQFAEALEVLAGATDNKDRHYYQGLCCKHLRQYNKAAEEFVRAADRGWDGVEIDQQLIEVNALSGDLEAAQKGLGKIEKKIPDSADLFYLRGLLDELAGRSEAAMEAYEQVRSIAPSHCGATFRLAYYYDLHGEEEQAIELYKECIAHPPVHANALLNLAILYEDAGKYDMAVTCLKRILATNPNHERARLFLKDARASVTMYYDEDRAKRVARRNAVLDIPVTDFELSVRARNCLKKMNIRSLGDLVRTTEIELLGYKNFGETSLKEIKDMLTAKGLRLGQALEEDSEFAELRPRQQASVGNEGVLATPISEIEFSVRARRALQALNLQTIGELAAKSEADLLACKNFGQTSLNEVRQRLGEYGLQLREPH
ncbi:MAG: tetratricopeptide repeat protein [Phycisphaerae bacterium]|nr:tetratricopeptide repeat protein [Phycisphaerae bacterium]